MAETLRGRLCPSCDRPVGRSHRCRGPAGRSAMPDWFRTALLEAKADQANRPDPHPHVAGQLPLPLHFTIPDPE